MSSKRQDACNALIEALWIMQSLPDSAFNIVVEVQPVHHDDEDRSTSYKVVSVAVNEVVYIEKEEDF